MTDSSSTVGEQKSVHIRKSGSNYTCAERIIIVYPSEPAVISGCGRHASIMWSQSVSCVFLAGYRLRVGSFDNNKMSG